MTGNYKNHVLRSQKMKKIVLSSALYLIKKIVLLTVKFTYQNNANGFQQIKLSANK